MKLTANQKKVLTALEFGARQSVIELSKKTGLRPTTVRHIHDWLIRKDIYKPYVCVDVTALGYFDYGIFVRHGMSAKERVKFLTFLKNISHVPWIAEMEGEFQFCFALIVRNPLELDRFLVSIADVIGHSVQEHCVAARLRWDIYPHKFMLEGHAKNETLSWGDPVRSVKLDKEETAVLCEICQNPNDSLSALARRIAIPASTFQYRLNNLIKNRVILAFLGYFNFNELGLRKYMLMVYEKKTESKFRKDFEAFCRQSPRVTTCLRVLSEWTYEIDVQISSAAELVSFRLELLEKFRNNISKVESLEYVKTHKICPYPGMHEEL